MLSLRLPAQDLHWRTVSSGTHQQFGMTYDLWRDRLVAVSCGRTLEWDGAAWQPVRTAHAPESRFGHRILYDTDRKTVLLYGGRAAGSFPRDLWEYDGHDWQRLAPPGGPVGRTQCAMAYDLLRRRCVVFGGNDEQGQLLGDTWEWNGMRWLQCSTSGPVARSGSAMAFQLSRGRTILFGGADAQRLRNDTWAWDGGAWVQLSPATTPPARAGHAMSADIAGDRVRMFGNSDTTMWEWNGDDWAPGASGPSCRSLCELATDEYGRCYLLGGQETASLFVSRSLGDLWQFEHDTWRQRTQNEAPPRPSVAVACDTARNRLVTVGPSEGLVTTTRVWEFDGETWSEMQVADEPPALNFSQACYQPLRSRTLLFGGLMGFFPVDFTCEWDGVAWRILRPVVAPSPRFDHAMAYDAARDRVVLFGGRTLNSTLRDTWLWDGASWSPAASTGPAARSATGLCYDDRRDRCVLFGGTLLTGSAAGSAFDDTWEWDGSGWQARQPAHAPSARARHGLAFDAGRGVAVCVGGVRNGQPLGDAFEYDGSDWRAVAAELPRALSLGMDYDRRGRQLVVVASLHAGDMSNGQEVAVASPALADADVHGTGCGGVWQPQLRPFGKPWLGAENFAVDVLRAPPLHPVLIGIAAAGAEVDLGSGCTFGLAASAGSIECLTDPSGFASLRVAVPHCEALLGLEAVLQAGTLDPSAPIGIALTPSVRLRIGD